MTRNRTISLPDTLDDRLGTTPIDNLSGLVAELLTRELNRRDDIAASAEMGVVTIDTESGPTYKFRGRLIVSDGPTDYYLHQDGSIVVWGEDGDVGKCEDPLEIFDRFEGQTTNEAADAIAEAVGLKRTVWL